MLILVRKIPLSNSHKLLRNQTLPNRWGFLLYNIFIKKKQMDLYNIATRLSKLVPDTYDNINQVFIYLKTNNTLRQLTERLQPLQNIKLSFYIDSIKKKLDRKTIEWLVNNGLYVFEELCIGENLGELNCRNCDGNGYFKCKKCNGNGGFNCRDCYGTGESYDEENDEDGMCGSCDGDGLEQCQSCDGIGEISCETCDGHGVVDDVIPEIIVRYIISYSLDLDSILEDYLTSGNPVDFYDILNKYPAIFSVEERFVSYGLTNSDVEGIKFSADRLSGNCYVNNIYPLDLDQFDLFGTYNNSIRKKEPRILSINPKLLN